MKNLNYWEVIDVKVNPIGNPAFYYSIPESNLSLQEATRIMNFRQKMHNNKKNDIESCIIYFENCFIPEEDKNKDNRIDLIKDSLESKKEMKKGINNHSTNNVILLSR